MHYIYRRLGTYFINEDWYYKTQRNIEKTNNVFRKRLKNRFVLPVRKVKTENGPGDGCTKFNMAAR